MKYRLFVLGAFTLLMGQQASGWYDLHGRKLSGTPNKGIYIYNGKKVMYPAHDSF